MRSITINGTHIGDNNFTGDLNISQSKGRVIINGKVIEGDYIGDPELNVIIEGDIGVLELGSGNIDVRGDIGTCKVSAGNVKANMICGGVKVSAGNITCHEHHEQSYDKPKKVNFRAMDRLNNGG